MKHADTRSALQTEVDQKREMAARLEQERADLEIEIAAFEVEYNAECKPLQEELDRVQRHIEEYTLRNELLRLRGNRLSASQLEAEVELTMRARETRAQADSSSPPPPHTPPDWARPASSAAGQATAQDKRAELKSLYRDLARRFHPDLAGDDAERQARGPRMAEINAAYAHGDLDALRQAAASADAPQRTPPSLDDLLAERERLDALIIRLRADIADLNRDPLLALKLDATLARNRGRDLLAEMATELHIRLVERRGALNRLIAEFRGLVELAGLTS